MMRIWELVEKIHFRSGNWGNDKITHDALVWLSEGLWHVTSEDLHDLYWLLLPTEKTSLTLREPTDISRLVSNLSVINTEKILNTSVFRSFNNVEQFISTLFSGSYPRKFFYHNGKIEPLTDSGATVMFL